MIHPTAIVETDVDSSCHVWAFAHILAGAVIGERVHIGDHTFIESGAAIGDNVTIKNGVCVWQGITIESNAFVGPHVTFTNDRFPRSPRTPAAQEKYATADNWLVKTLVRNGCSIGAAATICPGVTLGPFSMIAAGSVVTRDVAAFALVAGVPAKQIGCVCSCGERLSGPHDTTKCETCGEDAQTRMVQL